MPCGIRRSVDVQQANYDAHYTAYSQAQYDVEAIAPEELRRVAGRLGTLLSSFTHDPGQFGGEVIATGKELDRVRIELGTETPEAISQREPVRVRPAPPIGVRSTARIRAPGGSRSTTSPVRPQRAGPFHTGLRFVNPGRLRAEAALVQGPRARNSGQTSGPLL